MTTLVCRNNTGFDGESRSIAASIRAMAPYNFSWAVYVPKLKLGGKGIRDTPRFRDPPTGRFHRVNEVIVSDASEEGKCPGLESFRELRQANVRMLYRSSVEKCQREMEKKSHFFHFIGAVGTTVPLQINVQHIHINVFFNNGVDASLSTVLFKSCAHYVSL